MKKFLIFSVLSVIVFSLTFQSVFSQETGKDAANQNSNPYLCEDDWIEVMFAENSSVRLRSGSLIDYATDALNGVDQTLDQLEWFTWYRICDVPEDIIDQWSVNGERNTGKPVYNMNNIYRLQIPKGYNIWELSKSLENLSGIMLAGPVPKPMELPTPPNYQSLQGYLNPASSTPTGIDALYAWTQTGGTGTGVTVCDLEYSWNYNHGDISKAAGSQINTLVQDPFNDNNHGTAVIGELVADNNGWGTTGICYGSGLKTCGTYYGSPVTWNVPGAMAVAIAALSQGDIILLEQQWEYTSGSGNYIPVEWWMNYSPNAQTNNGVYAAIVNAISNGIHVVEAGGNGSVNTDGMTWYGNSGAIIVGAGGASISNDLQKLNFSSYGSRFDLQGWGENVVTTGYGGLYSAEGVNYYYTSTFNGTSSASPIVAGALACAEGYYLANVSATHPTPSYMRSHLKTYGTPQVTPPAGNIGPRPDLYNAIINFPQQYYDFGDAPDPTYPTLLASNGARHIIAGGVFLGALIDAEIDGQPHPNALGDDNNNLADEDGVMFTSPIIQGQNATVDVTASVSGGFLNAWIDFDGNGWWGDPGEQIFTGLMLAAGLNNLTFPVPASALQGISFARFRFSTQQGLNFDGAAPNGEVEDYEVFIEEGQIDELDWGDAPDPNYPTLAANNGANHWIDGITYLGNMIDGEPDGQPDAQAQGDDQDIFYPPPNDDEDGVVFTSTIIQGQNATVDVVASVPGILNAWFDFDANGSWADPGEHVFVDISLNPGLNNLTYNVPTAAAQGNTFARFRFSTIGGLNFDGPASDGEVEDYQIYIGIQTSDIPIDPDPTGSFVQNEISMALVPGTQPGIPAVLLAAYNDDPYPGGPGLGVSYSTDGGATWTPQQLPYPPDPYSGGFFVDMFDPTATADANGDLYVAQISTDYNWTTGPASGLFVHKSTDGGVTWLPPVAIATDGPPVSNPDLNYRFNDRCQIIADIDPASPYYNNLYIVWIKDRGWNVGSPLSDIYFSSSTDGGATWSTNVTINQTIHNMGNMPNPTVASDGTIYVCWMDYNVQTGGTGTIYLNISTDGGVTWLPTDIFVTTVNLPPLRLNGGTDVLAKGAAVIEVSPFNPQEIYIVYAEAITGTTDEGDIFFIKSTDGGQNWSALLRVNDDATFNDQVMPWMDVKPNGTIDIAWYDRRNDPLDLDWDVYIAMSTDGGNSFTPNIQVNSIPAPSPNTPSGYWMGEYLGLVVDNTHAYVGFTSSISDINGDVFFAKTQNPLAEIDFGDAPDPTYPTLLANNGARHNIDGITFLGSLIDAEPDGLQDPNALGDDNNNLADEDGIVFSQIIQGSPAQITVTTSTAGYLQGWMDFNADGDWADPGEQIFTDAYIHFGYTVCLNYLVPVNAIVGTTYARFRFSTVGGLSYIGLATDGEVEDYEVEIIQDPDIKWLQEPCVQLPGLHCTDSVEIIADDWECHGGLVTDIHWWGNYENNVMGGGINYFHLSIHDNDPTGTCLPLDPEIWGINVPLASVNEINTGLINNEGSIIYKYEYFLDIPFEQIEGNFYWLDICAYSNDPTDPAIWRWQESARSNVPILCPAAHFVPPWQSIVWNTPPPTRYSDMAFVITSEEIEDMDYGDAPDPFWPTLLASDGARHQIEAGFFLGASVDVEPDGQPQGFALGDDNNGIDDEDGIAFTTALIPGQMASVDVTLTDPTGAGGSLDAWIDFDLSGVFDAGEHLCGGVSCPLVAGVNTINFNVPAGSMVGPVTFARFRLSRNGGLLPTGLATDGEVEDYRVFIVEPGESKMHYPQLPDLTDTGIDVDMFWVPLADDFLCTETGPISEIVMWGSFADDTLPAAGVGSLTFKVTIYSDNPAGTVQLWSMPKDTLWTDTIYPGEYTVELVHQGPEWWYDPATYWWQPANHNLAYRYNFFFDDPFIQQLDSIYWLEIIDMPRPPGGDKDYTFGWKTSDIELRWNDDACFNWIFPDPPPWWVPGWNALTYPEGHEFQFTTLDFAFIIYGKREFDFGDANDPTYPTLLASSGAMHLIDTTLYLGNLIDAEPDGQPHPNALGDDINNLADEDGVTFTSSLMIGQPVTVDVIASAGGLLNAWMDFNANGSWAEAGEQIFTDVALIAGTNNLTFNIPSTAVIGVTFTRFRFSTVGGLLFTGMAPDGEVEDYEVEIEESNIKWVQYPDPNLPGLHAHDYDLPPYQAIILADDWVCEGGWVTDIHWWGNYELDFQGIEIRGAGIQYFHLSIHAHDPANCLPQDPEVWGVDVPFVALIELFTGMTNLEGSPIYLYEYILEDPFPQVTDVQYWLDITAVCVNPQDPAHWRWQESARNQTPVLCGAAEKTLPNPGVWNTISWTNDRYSDMAFIITSEPAPDLDLGDADDPTYPTLLINNGAAHIIDGVTYLGNIVDAEPDGQPTPDAKGDDNNGVPDDEDGVSIIFPFTPGGTAWLNIVASTNGILNAWIDYDGNGSWAEADEYIIQDQSLITGDNSFFIPVPANANVGTTYARFRFSTVGGLTYTGLAPDGEVEDHEVIIEGDLDFGDAPDQAFPSYPTLLASDGARHLVPITPTVYLGSLIDFEPDGLPDPNALGDDNNNLDDEDGVFLPAIVAHGQMNTITVTASINGFLNAWMDFNFDGDWDEADEHIFIDQSITAGNNTLIFNVPSSTYMGITFARFRFNTAGGLTYTGQADDGEVEDYEVEIGEPYKWLQEPDLSEFGLDVDATYDLQGFFPPLILADDFLCDITGPLTKIEIWGSWYHDHYPWHEDPGAVTFTLSIHKDIPAEQSPTGYSMPGEVLWFWIFNPYEFMLEPYAMGLMEGWYNPALPLYEPFGDTECWKYIFDLMQVEPFIQEGTPDEPVVYWLDVQAQPLDDDPECRFGWKTSVNHWNDDAVWTVGFEPYIGDWFELRYPEGHPWYPESIDLAFAIYGQEDPFILVDLTAFLEGPYNGSDMNTTLNAAGLIPFNQPYYSDPSAKWFYTGTESVLGIPNTAVTDWVLVELRDAPTAPLATSLTKVDQRAAFVLKDASIVATDGSSMIKFYTMFANNPFVVVWHRNHLGVLSANPMNLVGLGLYSYDFTTPAGQAYLNGQKDLGGTIYGMFGGDSKPDGSIDNLDKTVWSNSAGTTGYLPADHNMDTQVDNKDKNDVWVPNIGQGTQVPN